MHPIVRPLCDTDITGGLRLCRACGWNQLAEDWRALSGGFVIEKNGEIVGTSAFMRYDQLAWIAMMLVDPRERGQGLGRRLLDAALDAVSNVPAIGLDATPLGEPLYRSAGFVEQYRLVRLVGQASACGGLSARPTREADLPEVFARDREVFGTDRSALLRSLYTRAPEYAWIGGDGYMFGRPGHRYSHLGPVVDLDIAPALVPGRAFVIDVPVEQREFLERVKSLGFIEERPFVRMYLRRGGAAPRAALAIAGPEFG